MFKPQLQAYLAEINWRKIGGFDVESKSIILLYQEIAFVVFLITCWLSHNTPIAIINGVAAAVTLLFRTLGTGWSLSVRIWSLVWVISLSIMADTWAFGGLQSIFMIWYLAIPVPVLLIAGRRAMWQSVGIILLLVAITTVMQINDLLAPQPAPGVNMPLPLMSLVMMVLAILSFPLLSYTVLQQLLARQRNRNQELQLARDTLIHQRRQQDEFIASISHELRTPMNAILGFLQTVNPEHIARSSHKEMFGAMNNSAQHLLTVINDLLDFSQIQMGKLRVTPRPMSLHTLLHDVATVFRAPLHEAGIALEVSIDADVPNFIHGDADRITQIIMNLLGNATKFTREGRVTLRAHSIDNGQRIHIEVEDTGCGIAPAQLQTVFDRFSSLSEKTRREYGGTGLGLSISQNLVSLMGGTIGVHSVVDQGSVFWFELPVTPAREDELDTAQASGVSPRIDQDAIVLIVDDSMVNRMVAKQMLRQSFPHFKLIEAESGTEAIAIARHQIVDLVLMDVIMPEMDGIETTRQILALQSACPILGLTADVTESVHRACLQAGMLRLLTKPYSKAALISAVVDLLNTSTPQVPSPK